MEKAENCMIYGKMSHLPWGSKATYKRKKFFLCRLILKGNKKVSVPNKMPFKGPTLGKCGADMKHFGYRHYQSNSPVWKKVPFLMEKAENCMIYGKMSHLPWGSKATYKRKKYPAVQRPANWNFSAWKMRRVQDVQPPKHSQYSRTFHERPPKMSSLGGRLWEVVATGGSTVVPTEKEW